MTQHRQIGRPAYLAEAHEPLEPIDPRPRCSWAGADGPRPDRRMVEYHDLEWGTAVHDDLELFERLALESFQAGLSWSTILQQARRVPGRLPRLRPDGRRGLRGGRPGPAHGRHGHRPQRAPRSTPRSATPPRSGRSRRASGRSTRTWRARLPVHIPRLPRTAQAGDIPAATPAAEALSRDLQARGFRFVGPTIVYAFMQSVGLVDDHLPTCFRYRGRGLSAAGAAGARPQISRRRNETIGQRQDHDGPQRHVQRRTRGGGPLAA